MCWRIFSTISLPPEKKNNHLTEPPWASANGNMLSFVWNWENWLRWYPQQPQRFIFYKSFCSVLRYQALETPELGFRELNGRKSCWTWPGSAPKPSPEPSPNLLRNPVEPNLALHQSLPDLLRNKPSPEPSPEPSSEPCWNWPGFDQSVPDLLRNLLRNNVGPDLALYQSLPDLLRNLLRNPVEPDLALHQSLPDVHRNLLRNPVEPDLALHWSLGGMCAIRECFAI